MPPRRRFAHAVSIAALACLTLAWLWSLLRQADTVVPGASAGDNLMFVWNGWWMRNAWRTGSSFITCPVLFAPFGVDLTLHTHNALSSALAALLSRGGSIVAATNAVIALHLFLNCVVAYAMAWRVTRSTAAAMLAAVVFGWSPYVNAHLLGHFHLVAVWVFPLCALLSLQALASRTWTSAALLGAALGSVTFVDYYYAIYCGLLVLVLVLDRNWLVVGKNGRYGNRPAGESRWRKVMPGVIGGLLLADLVALLAIATTGGTVFTVGRLTISARTADNPITLAGLLVMAGAAVAWLPWRWPRLDWRSLGVDLRGVAISVAVAMLVSSPLLLPAIRLWQRGDYVTQRYLWRSAPAGVDTATLLLGNPAGWLWGGGTLRAYAAFGIDRVEQVAWLGPAVIVLCAVAVAQWRRDSGVRRWALLGGVFLIWALGPYLMAFGASTHVMLPSTLVRFVPIVANARIPGRAMVVVYLAASMLCAVGFASLRAGGRTALAVVLGGAVVLDYAPARPLLFRIDHPAIYDVLRQQTGPGTVCELPLGLRDGFGETGHFDSRVMIYQTIHERPMTGGVMSRLPPRILEDYRRDAVLGPLLRLSGGAPLAKEPPADRATIASALTADDIRFIVVDRPTAPPDLLTFIRTTLPLRVIADDTERTLYAVVR